MIAGKGIPNYKRGFARAYPNLRDGLVGLWAPYLGPTGLTLRDWSGRKNNGTLTNLDLSSAWAATDLGYAIKGDGVDGYVDLSADDPLEGLSAWSLSLWYRAVSVDADQDVLAKGKHAASNPFVLWRDQATPDKWAFLITDDAADYSGVKYSTSSAAGTGIWQHLGMTFRGNSEARLYIDGNWDSTHALVGVGEIASTADKLRLLNCDTDIKPADGYLGLVAFWNRVVPSSFFATLYTEPHAPLTLRSKVYPTAVAAGFVSQKHHILGGGIAA
jgi:hypothetical protein